MRQKHLIIGLIVGAVGASLPLCAQVMEKKLNYPSTRKDPSVVENYHGVSVADPYRWLEDDNSEETKAWVKAQNAVTFDYLKGIPFRDLIKNRLQDKWNYEKYGAPFKEGDAYYFFKNDGLQNQAVLYRQADLKAPAQVFLDPNALSKEGTVALGALVFNQKGDKVAYQLANAGSDWQTIYVKDVKTGQVLSDEVRWVRYSGISWAGDGFFYGRYPEPEKGKELTTANMNQKIYFHKVGTPQSDDVLVLEDPEHPKRGFGAQVTDDERYLVVTPWENTSGQQLLIKDLKKGGDFVKIATDFKHDWRVIGTDGDLIYVHTNHKAARWRVVAINLSQPEEAAWKTIVPENSNDVLQAAAFLGDKLIVQWLHNAASRVDAYTYEGRLLNAVALPGIGTVGGLSGKKGDNKAFYSFSSFTRPNTIYELDLNSLKSVLFKAPNVKFDADKYTTEQVWYTSKDGTKVPMFITYKKGLKRTGKNPTLLYGYGGFNISLQPSFSVQRALLLEMGGIYCVANLRGGGEFGEAWYRAGTKAQKQNVFDDFIAAAEFLIKEKYTSKDYLAIQGGSNGGLLVGACMTQRPDLFRVAFPAVGVLDMLRYDKFTIGRAWAGDYGLSENKEDFEYLYKYSPLHNVKNISYPATLITTGDHDDRVVPAHSFKFAATLQDNQQGLPPALIRIETAAGHGAGKPTGKVIEEAADILAFMFYNMGIKIR